MNLQCILGVFSYSGWLEWLFVLSSHKQNQLELKIKMKVLLSKSSCCTYAL